MSTLELILLAVALAMDCFSVSLASGVIVRRTHWDLIWKMAFLFGLFQAGMPLLGWLGVNTFSSHIESVGHWIAFGLLLFVGGRMVKEAFEEESHFNPFSTQTLFVLSLATSIDALAIGASFACIGYETLGRLLVPLIVIGATSLLFSLLGHLLGIRFGDSIAKRIRPELLGGLILILIGVKILLEHFI